MDKKKDIKNKSQQEAPDGLEPDPETLHTPDPQDKMRGPFSSVMHNILDAVEPPETKKEAREKRDKHM